MYCSEITKLYVSKIVRTIPIGTNPICGLGADVWVLRAVNMSSSPTLINIYFFYVFSFKLW